MMNETLHPHIGQEIERILGIRKISKSEFGRRIGVPQQNINRILERPNIDTERLILISNALDFNFFELYIDINESTNINLGNSNQINESGATQNTNITGGESFLLEKIKSLEAQLADKEKIIRLYETMNK